MMKKALAAVAVSLVAGLMAAGPAVAVGNSTGNMTADGDGAKQVYGNQMTGGHASPSASVGQGSLNKLCAGVPLKGDLQTLVAVPIPGVGVGVQDIPVLSSKQNSQCASGSSQTKGDEAASHLLNDISGIAGNGSANH
ncbi:RdlA protein [Mangrovactinospora gilvigrisea]|uniref:RdlA protein n=1 Tax=Mangrovactinospora gilvigrisea TaxID=1428644 RepID=A0A1J7BEY9_9ACTN|nr:rodlin [Mangrovactinospora gilvigrisea]OIV37141.1 RdlA protein [Mangrovactinospora gilvigrisea]